MFRVLIGWMDRDWASRKYNPLFAFRQRMIWAGPMLVSIAAISVLDALGFSRDSLATLTVFALGATGTFAIMLVSLYRWAIGYSHSAFQEQAAKEHRARVAARRAFIRRWRTRNGNQTTNSGREAGLIIKPNAGPKEEGSLRCAHNPHLFGRDMRPS